MNVFSLGGFTNLGYRLSARDFDDFEADMTGQTVVITGATAGLGLATARQLAGYGARLVIVGRNPEKTHRVQDEIRAATGADVTYQIADLSSMSEVGTLADRLLASEPRIDVLINNAGALFPERSITDEGLERSLATNLLGHFILTNRLIPRLIESAPSRIINISSGGMYSQRIATDDLLFEKGEYTGSAAYARTKRGQVILTELWAEQLRETDVVVNSMHPGWARTPGVADSLPGFNRFMGPFLRSPEEGADTMVWLAAAPEAGEFTGQFLLDRTPRDTHMTTRTRETPEERQQLWDRLEQLSATALT